MKKNIIIIIMLASFLFSCQSWSILISGGKDNPPPRHERRGPKKYRSYQVLKIPPGHLPPPGRCRVWIPRRPPGHQPPSTSCSRALREAPPGSWVITRMGDNRDLLEVKEMHNSRKGVIIETEIYLID